LTPQRSASPDRVRPRAGGDRVRALALGAVVLLLAAAPALGARPPLDGGGGHGPGGGEDAPRPVATRPAGRPAPPESAQALAVRGLRVPKRVALATATREGIAVSFVPRPGSLVADVRLVAGNRLVVRRLAPVRAGRRATVRLRAAGVRPGAYAVAVRAGAGPATLGPAVVARVVVG
jgi:hypothetical protein